MKKHYALSKSWRVLLVLLIGFILTLSTWLAPSVTHAQDPNALDRIDDALADLSQLLGRNLTRQNVYWTWTEQVYPTPALGCPDPDQVYTQVQTRGYSINIEVDGEAYNYRATPDGSVFFRCVDGRPASSQTGGPTPTLVLTPPPTSGTGTPLGDSAFWAWAYSQPLDTLFLLNADGEAARIARPRLPTEANQPVSQMQLAISRDARYLLLSVRFQDDSGSLGIYDLAEGQFVQVHPAQPGEQIGIGFQPGMPRGGSPYIFDETGQYVAVTYYAFNFEMPENSTWRVAVYDLATGNPLYQIDQAHPGLPVEQPPGEMVFPRVVYFGEDTVHIQMLPAFGEGVVEYPAFAWHPNANFFEASTYTQGDMDILAGTSEIVFPYLDESFNRIEPFSPFVPFNAIGTGDPDSPERLWVDGTAWHSWARWANSGQQVLFRTVTGPQDPGQWNLLDFEDNSVTRFDPALDYVVPLPEGFLSVTTGGRVQYHPPASPTTSSLVWQMPADSEAVLIWGGLPGTDFGLEQLSGTDGVAASGATQTPSGDRACPAAPPSRMTVGQAGRVTFTDGTPTRLRAAPTGTILQLMPEGTPFIVIAGPQCQGELAWWQVRLSTGETGWVAEGEASRYFIEPMPEG